MSNYFLLDGEVQIGNTRLHSLGEPRQTTVGVVVGGV